MAKEAQELFCHNCQKYVRFNLDTGYDGNYRIPCPECGHEHFRVVKDGKVTDERWGSSNQNVWQNYQTTTWTTVTVSTATATSSFDSRAGDAASYFLQDSWNTSSYTWST